MTECLAKPILTAFEPKKKKCVAVFCETFQVCSINKFREFFFQIILERL